MSSLFGGGVPKGGFNVTGGGTGAPWNWGVSPFDQSMIDAATGSDMTSMKNRYSQLGLGGSTAEGEDLGALPSQTGGIAGAGGALTGQLQTQNVGNPALNPALQPQINQLIAGPSGGGNIAGSLGNLASLAGNALGGSAAAGGEDVIGDAALGAALV